MRAQASLAPWCASHRQGLAATSTSSPLPTRRRGGAPRAEGTGAAESALDARRTRKPMPAWPPPHLATGRHGGVKGTAAQISVVLSPWLSLLPLIFFWPRNFSAADLWGPRGIVCRIVAAMEFHCFRRLLVAVTWLPNGCHLVQ
jgi:hypothetical protein